MPNTELSHEQHEHLHRHIIGFGHNQGPALIEHADTVLERATQHHRLHAELTGIRVMFDMMRSHVAGEYVLPPTTAAYVASGLTIIGLITGVSITTQPISALLLDTAVVGFIVATLHGEIQGYVDWRAARDPSYGEFGKKLFHPRSP
jgi:hypothetical protein